MNEENGGNETAGQENEGTSLRSARSGAQVETDAAVEPLRRENEQLRELIQIRDAKDVMTEALRVAGGRSPALLFAYAVDDLQFDQEGAVSNSAALVEKLRRAFPEQFGPEAARHIDAGAGGTSHISTLTKETLAKMKPAEIAKLDWAQVRRVLSEK